MNTLLVNGATYWLPENNNDLTTLIQDAKTNNEIICMRGAAHSFPLIGTLEQGSASGRKYKYVMLSKMNAVNINLAAKTVTVQAGCHLGIDPWDPTGISTLQNSLLYQLDQVGLGLPDLGGITHQTVGGFLSTSSSGGSTQFAFEDALLSIDIMHCDAGGVKVTTFSKPATFNANDPFYAIGVATMGVFGIIVSATFQCCDKFYIAGSETTTSVEACEIDLFGDGTPDKMSYEQFLEQKQTAPFPSDTTHYTYSRMIWWPQKSINKIVLWKARQTDQAGAESWAIKGYNAEPKPPAQPWPALKPYQEVPYIMGSPTLATLGAYLMFTAIGTWPTWLLDVMGDTEEYKIIKALVDGTFYPLIYPALINSVFVTNGIQYFSDDWYTGLPMDNQMSDQLMPVHFTELWIPIDQTKNVMNDLNTFYSQGEAEAGYFTVEIYAAKSSPFWLCPAYNTDVIRIDVFWFAKNTADPTAYYQKFWDLLAKYNYRPHWGKYMPDGASNLGASYLKSVYPKWNDWVNLRAQMDPDRLFVNDYWQSHLGI